MPQTIPQSSPSGTAAAPLCVDLDGTLVKSDTLVDSLLALARNHPLLLLQLPLQLPLGKAAFKRFVTANVSLDVAHLPYHHQLLHFLHGERLKGRQLYLATGADQSIARRVAAHLGIFTDVLGSDGAVNLTGSRKLASLRARFGGDHFGYIGNARADLPLLAACADPMVANPSLGLRLGLKTRGMQPNQVFVESNHPARSLLKAARLHQWAKNLLIFVPLLLSHALHLHRMLAALLAFFCFSLTASSAYIVNDLLDLEADRRHSRKRLRPFAAGDLPASAGVAMVAAFLLAAFSAARLLPIGFTAWLLLYLATTLAYSAFLKRIALVDVLALSGLYTLRLMAGGAATYTAISHWLAGFSMFLFLSLAIVKRFAELENLRASGTSPKNGRGYLVADIQQMRSFGTASAFAAVVVFANYISGRDVVKLYHHPKLLWLVMPLMIYWLGRVWLLASRGELDEDPVAFALSDRSSLLIGIMVAALAWFAL